MSSSGGAARGYQCEAPLSTYCLAASRWRVTWLTGVRARNRKSFEIETGGGRVDSPGARLELGALAQQEGAPDKPCRHPAAFEASRAHVGPHRDLAMGVPGRPQDVGAAMADRTNHRMVDRKKPAAPRVSRPRTPSPSAPQAATRQQSPAFHYLGAFGSRSRKTEP